ncbi:hypothetical protein CB599_11630 [Salmonella enterica subsp. enterica serovar Adjame]|nr:hypothetical protein [Salmonella enterica subsp. enterica serovar Adjame]
MKVFIDTLLFIASLALLPTMAFGFPVGIVLFIYMIVVLKMPMFHVRPCDITDFQRKFASFTSLIMFPPLIPWFIKDYVTDNFMKGINE